MEQTDILSNLNTDAVIRNLVDLPDQNARNAYLKESKNKFRKTKNYTSNPITRETIQKLYDISEYEINKLKKVFDTYSGVDRKLNFQEYVRLYGYMNQSLRGPKVIQIAEYAFQQGDVDNDGLINFDQFLITYALTKSYGAISNRKELNTKQLQDFSNLNTYYPSKSSKYGNTASHYFINENPLALEYNQEKSSTLKNLSMTQSYHPEQKHNLPTVINSISDKNLYAKNY